MTSIDPSRKAKGCELFVLNKLTSSDKDCQRAYPTTPFYCRKLLSVRSQPFYLYTPPPPTPIRSLYLSDQIEDAYHFTKKPETSVGN